MNDDKYLAAKHDAQIMADEYGYDYGLEYNKIYRQWFFYMLPMKKNRYGHELTCEVVYSNNPKKGYGYTEG